MPTKTSTSGRIRQADYDPASRQLDLHWGNKTVLAYKQVPEAVFRRLCSAPYPATYWEDRIAEEYPMGTPMKAPAGSGVPKWLRDLFGAADQWLQACRQRLAHAPGDAPGVNGLPIGSKHNPSDA